MVVMPQMVGAVEHTTWDDLGRGCGMDVEETWSDARLLPRNNTEVPTISY